MTSIEIDDSSFDPTVRKLGLVAGILETAGAGKVRFLLDWFSDPIARLRETPNRRNVLLPLLREQLGGDPIAPGKNQAWSWYPLDRETLPNGVFVVLPEKDDAGSEAVIGIGLRARTEGTSGSVDCYVHIPLFTIPPKANPLIAGDDQHPIRVWIDGASKGGDVTLRFTSEVRFNAPPVFKLEIKVKTLELLAKTLEELRSDPVRVAIKALLDTDVLKDWLARKLGSTALTVSAFLEAIHILAKGGDGKWELAKLDQFKGAAPLEIAQIVIADILNVLAETKKPVVTFKGGGLDIVRRDADGGAKDFGFRVAAPDITTRKSDRTPGIVVHVGKWLSGEDDKTAWVHRDAFDPKSAIKENGLIATFLRVTTSGTSRTFAFRPAIEMASIGFDAVGPKGKPLVDVNGFTLDALEVRYYFRADFNTSAVIWGGAVRCKNIGVPLGGGTATTAIANPVVQNLLSAGKKGKGSDNKPVNPTFSASVARILRSEPTQMAVWLDPTNGAGNENEVAFPIQSSFGPLRVTRVTVRWPRVNPNSVLTFALDASVTIEALEVALAGFAVGIPLGSAGTFSTYSFDLAGLGVSFEAPPIAIEAALVSSKDAKSGVTRYDGKAVIRAKKWSIAGLGSYTVIDGAPSMFLFAFFRSAMGGPPFCFVTGVCAGFGYNRALRLPDRDKVNEFPLLAALDDPKAIGGENATPDQAMKKLNDGKWIEPSHGSHWLAAGLQFTTYQIVKTNAILFVLFGNRNELALLGVSRLRLPQNDEAREFAYAELGIQATLDLDSGFFGVSAILSPNSYVLTPECHLTGGFAFYAWLGREHNGDFVLTLGGYHPAFAIPAHYPRVPRLGFSWQVNDSLTISGESYFAITPTCAMGGGMLQVQYHSGNLRAWFIARADFLLQWKPFYYSGRVAVSIGASYRLNLLVTTTTVSAELGASLEIWGPPTGGRVEVDWYVISFGVSFGASRQGPKAINWDQFDQLLPHKRSAPKALLGAAAANDAEVVTISFSDASSKSGEKWIIRPATLQIAVSTVIPTTEANVGAKAFKPANYSTICVRAMKQCDVKSTLKITLTQDGGTAIAIDKWNSDAVYGGVPEGMWGEPVPGETAPPPDAKVLPDRLLGIEKLAPPKPQLTGPDAFPQQRVAYEPVTAADGTRLAPFLPLRSDATSIKRQPRVDDDRVNVIANTIASPAAQQRRAELVALFGEFGIERNDPMNVMKNDAKTLFAAAPFAGSTEVTR